MTSKSLFRVLSAGAMLIGLYPLVYFFVDKEFGLLQTKNESLLADVFWSIGFYLHILPGSLALLIGWAQFNSAWRKKHPGWHKVVGKVYVFCCLVSALAGIYIAFYATGGVVASTGFFLLGVIWFYTTWSAYRSIRQGLLVKHHQMMVFSYAACCSAITLRIYLPLLILIFQHFITAYLIVAWLCWVPNIGIAYQINRKIAKKRLVQ